MNTFGRGLFSPLSGSRGRALRRESVLIDRLDHSGRAVRDSRVIRWGFCHIREGAEWRDGGDGRGVGRSDS